jgi:5'-nucleotidase
LIRKLLGFKTVLPAIDVAILSRNDPATGLRLFNSARHHGLDITRGVFTQGAPPWSYLAPLQANLFLSCNADDVRAALACGHAAARVMPRTLEAARRHPDELRIAFDGDAVLFSDEAERVYQQHGLQAFERHESERATLPLPPGPFKPLLQALQVLRSVCGANGPMRLRTALVTARSAPAHARAINTLASWNIEVDEAMFLGGLEKAPFLEAFGPDFFFDDQQRHCEPAAHRVPTGHVITGVANEARFVA